MKRIVRIMTERAARRLDSKPLLVTADLVAVALPVAFGWLQPTQAWAATRAQNTAATGPVYEVASIKPNKSDNGLFRMMFEQDGFSATSVTLRMPIRTA